MVDLAQWGELTKSASLAVLGIHGRNQDADFIKELSDRLEVGGIAYFAPTALGKSWYPKPFLEGLAANKAALVRAMDTVEQSISMIRGAYGGPVAVVGFSQGSCVLSHFLLTRSTKVDGAVLFTGGYVGQERLSDDVLTSRPGMPVLLRSVENDPWVPAHRVADTARFLSQAGNHVDVLIEAGSQHVITELGIADGREFLTSLSSR